MPLGEGLQSFTKCICAPLPYLVTLTIHPNLQVWFGNEESIVTRTILRIERDTNDYKEVEGFHLVGSSTHHN